MSANESDPKYLVAVVGAGPAGLYASRELVAAGARVALFNRDVKPGGLAEYGIFHNKLKMKGGLRKQFAAILEDPRVEYYGNVSVGEEGDLSLQDLLDLGFQAILVTVGAQGTKWLGLPGEELERVYHAKDVVYHYNHLPPFSQQDYPVGDSVVIIGIGNRNELITGSAGVDDIRGMLGADCILGGAGDEGAEVLLCLPRKTNDDVCRDRQVGYGGSQTCDTLDV
ncbi:MAG: FAD-dependent oxidoreductase [Acidobacteria bacterium]|nr:FAD-dependent oxidoreductase [Acidobacteriota bacterium]